MEILVVQIYVSLALTAHQTKCLNSSSIIYFDFNFKEKLTKTISMGN